MVDVAGVEDIMEEVTRESPTEQVMVMGQVVQPSLVLAWESLEAVIIITATMAMTVAATILGVVEEEVSAAEAVVVDVTLVEVVAPASVAVAILAAAVVVVDVVGVTDHLHLLIDNGAIKEGATNLNYKTVLSAFSHHHRPWTQLLPQIRKIIT